MKYVYLVKNYYLYNGRFEINRTNCYSSLSKAKSEIKNVIEVNKGFNVETETMDFGLLNEQTTYTCMSTDGREMKLRLILEKMLIE